MDIGENIKELRNKNNLTQEELATKTGLSKNAIWNYENNKRKPNIEILNKIANALGVPINYLVGSKKTITQQAIEMLIKEGFTIQQIAKEANIPIDDLKNMFNNNSFNLGTFRKLFKYLGSTDEQMIETLMKDLYTNCVYNNDGNDPEKNVLKKMFLGETLSLDEVLMNTSEEDKEFLTQMYYAGALNTNGVIKDTNSPKRNSIKLDINDLDIMGPIEHLLKFMQTDNYPINKLNNKTLRYLYEKITDLLEFEFYRLEKNDFKVPNNENSK